MGAGRLAGAGSRTRCTATGRSLPFALMGGAGSRMNAPGETRACVRSPMRISPGLAAEQMRLATFVVSPITAYWM